MTMDAGWSAEAELDSLASEIVRAYEELHLLYDLGETLATPLSVAAVADAVLDKVSATLRADAAVLRVAGKEPLTFSCPAGATVPDPGAASNGSTDLHLASVLRSGGLSVGDLALQRHPASGPFGSADGKLLDAVCALAANAIRNAQLYERLHRQADSLRESETRLRSVLENVADGILTIDSSLQVLSVNPAGLAVFGYGSEDIAGKRLADLMPKAVYADYEEAFLRYEALGEGRIIGAGPREAMGVRRDGSTFPIELAISPMAVGPEQLFIVSVRDITERKQFQQTLEHQALHDVLTGLPNRSLLQDRTQQAILGVQRDGKPLALLVMDLDRFKDVNDTLGHHYGDLLLQEAAHRLRGLLRSSDTVARLGGDEFAVLLPTATLEGATLAAQKVVSAFQEPFLVEGHTVEVGVSIGIALCPDHGVDPSSLLRRADVAMYSAKRAGCGYALYSAAQDQHTPTRLVLIGELRKAIDAGELVLHYQPKLGQEAAEVTGVEALVRWHHPKHGLIPPDVFIGMAEQTGLIQPLSRWVLCEALRQCRAWRDEGLRVAVAVNLSMRNLHDPGLPRLVAELLAQWGASPEWLRVEITESSLMVDPGKAMEVLTELRQLGVRIAIDDFGTGYSSLAYLKRLPVDELKIDKSFVKNMATDEDDATIVRSTIGLAHDLGLTVVAEGVEDNPTWQLLNDLLCDSVQGYYISRPVPADILAVWLRDRQQAADQLRISPSPTPAERGTRKKMVA